MKIKSFFRKNNSLIQLGLRRINSNKRSLPDFLIIGAQKAGTTSLYSYLSKHPMITPAFIKEVHYFDLNYGKGIKWYKSFFPLMKNIKINNNFNITGEASPQYMFHPHSIKRISRDLPNIKIIILLRNPISRSFSHFNHQTRVGRESLSFEKAIEAEGIRIKNEYEKMIANENYNSFNYLMYSYIQRSIYYLQIKNILSYFDHENVLILQSEKFNKNPQEEYNRVLSFLNLSPHEMDFSKKYNAHKYPPIKEETRQKLEEFFKPHNEKLFDLIGERFDW